MKNPVATPRPPCAACGPTAPEASPELVNLCQIADIRGALRELAKWVTSVQAVYSLNHWVKRRYGLRHIMDMPAAKVPELLSEIERQRLHWVHHHVAVQQFERRFVAQMLGGVGESDEDEAEGPHA